MAAAWHEPPAGFRRRTDGECVTWAFQGDAVITGPPDAAGALVTARGSGSVSGTVLCREFEVEKIGNRVLEFSGQGEITSVRWLKG